jgi:electron transport complex protein RnfC
MLEYVPERHLTGGLRLDPHKSAAVAVPIRRGLVPRQLIIPLQQHRGDPAKPSVAIGQRVLKGAMIGVPGSEVSTAVHASSSGWVRAIEERPVLAGNGVQSSLCVIIETDGTNEASTATDPVWPSERAAQLERIRSGGIVGLGGAVFSTATKLASVAACKILIVNGAECEPYISCDDVLMREAAREIVDGALLMTDLLAAPLCVIAVERDKQAAHDAIGAAAIEKADPRLKLAEVPTIYPAGGERQLIELLTGDEVPSAHFPSEIGYVCQNVGTVYALQRLARKGEPLTNRVVTVTGRGVHTPQNVETPLGTTIADLVEFCGGYTGEAIRLIGGGSMMGYSLPSDDLPIGKASNCIIAAAADEIRTDPNEWPCIRCGECAEACPARLLPQELLVAAQTHDHDALAILGLRDCIECGCCDVICPSHIALTERFRRAKLDLAFQEAQIALSAEADERFRRREQRLHADEERDAELRHSLKNAARDDESRRQTIEAAIERSGQRRTDRDGH